MNILVAISLLICIFLPIPAHAILNVESMSLAQDEDGMVGSMGLSAQGTQGNSTKQSTEVDGQLLNQYGDHSDALILSYDYGTSQGERNASKAFAHLRHRYQWLDPWGLEAFLQIQRDEFARLTLRTLLGAGIRYLYESKTISFSGGLGSFYELEKYESRVGVADVADSRLWRGNMYLALLYPLKQGVRLANTIYYQPAWSDLADVRILDEASLKVAVMEHLDLKVSVNISYDSRPPEQVKSLDVSYKTALEFSF